MTHRNTHAIWQNFTPPTFSSYIGGNILSIGAFIECHSSGRFVGGFLNYFVHAKTQYLWLIVTVIQRNVEKHSYLGNLRSSKKTSGFFCATNSAQSNCAFGLEVWLNARTRLADTNILGGIGIFRRSSDYPVYIEKQVYINQKRVYIIWCFVERGAVSANQKASNL